MIDMYIQIYNHNHEQNSGKVILFDRLDSKSANWKKLDRSLWMYLQI